MSENKTGKYFKYAIGEIILVVIGILIALQINNWNENQKTELRSQNLFKELYTEFEASGNLFKNSYENGQQYTTFLEDILINWGKLDLSLISKFRTDEFAIKNISILFYLSSYSQWNDPQIVIYQKAVNDGTINLVDNEFVKAISRRYNIMTRLNELIAQEYEIGQQINLHIAKTYGDILVDFEETRSVNLDPKTLDKLFIKFRSDGTLKFLIRSRLDLARIRGQILKNSYSRTEESLKTFKYLFK